MLFDQNLGKFELAFVGDTFEDALQKRDTGHYSESLERITGRRTNEITAEELDLALNSSDDQVRSIAQNIKLNNKTFLLTVCNSECRRRVNGRSAAGLGTHVVRDINGRSPSFQRKVGNKGQGNVKLCNDDIGENHHCPTSSSNNYSFEDKKPDGVNYFLSDQFTIEVISNPGDSRQTSIYMHQSRLTRAPAHFDAQDRINAIQKLSHHGYLDAENLYIRRTSGSETDMKVKMKKDEPYWLGLRKFRPGSRECRYFIGKLDIDEDYYTKRGLFTEHLLHYQRGKISLNLSRDNGLLLWIPAGSTGELPEETRQILQDLYNETDGGVCEVNDREEFAQNYNGTFVFFSNIIWFKNNANQIFSSLENAGVLHRQARPIVSPKPNWISLAWHPSHTPEFYAGHDSWDFPIPDLISRDGQLHLLLKLNSRKIISANKSISLFVKMGDEIQQKGQFITDDYGRIFISIQFPKVGNYVVGIEDGSNFRFMQVNVVGSGQTGLISVKYSDRNQEWQVLPRHDARVEETQSSIVDDDRKGELLNHYLENEFGDLPFSIHHLNGYSREHALREVTRATWHHHLGTWIRKRNKLFSLILDRFDSHDDADDREIGEYIKCDLVSYGIRNRTDPDETIYWERLAPCAQRIVGIDSHCILHDSRTNVEIEALYDELLIDQLTGVRIIPKNVVESMNLEVHEILPKLDKMVFDTAENFIQSIWDAGKHTSEPLPILSDDFYTVRWAGSQSFNRSRIESVVNTMKPPKRIYGWNPNDAVGWTAKASYGDKLVLQINQKLFFIQLTISKEKRDQKYPFTVHLGCFDFEGTVTERGVVIATESVDADRQLISWINSLGISNGPTETEMRLPWFRYPRGSKAGDSNYLLRELIRAFSSLHLKLSNASLARNGLPPILFRNQDQRVRNPYAFNRGNNQLGIYDVCQSFGILPSGKTPLDLSECARKHLLERMWWDFED